MSIVGERSILAVVFDDRTTIGMVRLYAKETSAELAAIFQEVLDHKSEEVGISSDFADKAQDKLDDIFQD